MKNLKLLNRKYLSVISLFLFFGFATQSQEPADIWNVEVNKKTKEEPRVESSEVKGIPQNTIYEMQSQKKNKSNIEEDLTLASKKVEIVGLYDPSENGLDINMWSNSNGDQLLSIFKRINKIDSFQRCCRNSGYSTFNKCTLPRNKYYERSIL